MLGKLIKHEFRATGRIMLPMYLVLLLTALGSNLTSRGMISSRYAALNLLAALIVMAFAVSIGGVFIVSFMLMIQRFYKNLLQDEGYLMLTLPVSIHQHVWAKLIVSAVWFAATIFAVVLAAMVVAYDVGILRELLHMFSQFFQGLQKLKISEALNGTVFLAEFAAFCFLGLMAFSLQFYAALAAGHSRPNHKMLWSVILFFVFQFIVQFGGGMLMVGLDNLNAFKFMNHFFDRPESAVPFHAAMLFLIVCVVIYGAIFYAVTTFFLKRHLNLE